MDTLVSVPPLAVIVPPKFHVTVVPLGSTAALVHFLVAVIEHSGKETGVVKSLRVALGVVEERLSAKKVLKQGADPNKLVKSRPTSRNSPVSKLGVGPRCLSVKLHGAVTFTPLTIPHKFALPVRMLHS